MVVALPVAIATLFLPRVWLMRRRAQRMLELQGAWPDGLRDLVASISSGMSLARSLEQLSITGPAPLREAFARFPSLSRALGVVPALESIKADLAHPTSDRIIEVMIVAHERGGPIVLSILRDLTDATTKDMWVGEELATLALEQKINARVVFVIPWVVLAFITTRPGPFRDFYASSAGVLVVAIGGAASLIGMWLRSQARKGARRTTGICQVARRDRSGRSSLPRPCRRWPRSLSSDGWRHHGHASPVGFVLMASIGLLGPPIDSPVPVGSALKLLARLALAPMARRIGRLVDRDGGAERGSAPATSRPLSRG